MKTGLFTKGMSLCLSAIMILSLIPIHTTIAMAAGTNGSISELPNGSTLSMVVKASAAADILARNQSGNKVTIGDWLGEYSAGGGAINGYGYCMDHTKPASSNGTSYKITTTPYAADDFTKGCYATGFPAKNVQWLRDHLQELAVQGVKQAGYEQNLLKVWQNFDEVSKSSLAAYNDTELQSMAQKATQLSIWHAIHDITIKDAYYNSSGSGGKFLDEILYSDQSSSQAKTILRMAQAITFNAFTWKAPKVTGGKALLSPDAKEDGTGQFYTADSSTLDLTTSHQSIAADGKPINDGDIKTAVDSYGEGGLVNDYILNKQTGPDGQEYYVCYFNYYSNTDVQGISFDFKMTGSVPNGTFVCNVTPDLKAGSEYLTHKSSTITETQKRMSTTGALKGLGKTRWISEDLPLHPAFVADNGSQYGSNWGLAKICIPTTSIKKNEAAEINVSVSNHSACQYNVYLTTPTKTNSQPFLVADPNTFPVNGKFTLRWGAKTDITPPEPGDPGDGGGQTITLLKADSTSGKLLAGATYQFWSADAKCPNNERKHTAVTDANGTAIVSVPEDEYFDEDGNSYFLPCVHRWNYQETTAPVDYKLDQSICQCLPIAGGNIQLVSMDIPNMDGSGSLQKVDSLTKRGVSGAVFDFVNTDTGNHFARTTDATGMIYFQCLDKTADTYLPRGGYSVTEKSPPPGYEKSAETQTFHLGNASDVGIALHFENMPMSEILIQKVDASNKHPMVGVVFDYWFNGTYEGATEPTNAAGQIKLKDLKTGTYSFKERNEQAGYTSNNETYSVYVNADQFGFNQYNVYVQNYPRNTITLHKVDAKTGAPIAGVSFKYYRNNTYVGTTVETDADGLIVIPNLDTATYTFEENGQVNGYSKNHETYNVFVNCEDLTTLNYDITIKNYALNNLTILKLDAESNQPVPGVVFSYSKDGQHVGTTQATDANGRIYIVGLDTGTYVFREISGPPGYTINPEDYEIRIDCQDITKTEYMLDILNYEKRTLIITKEDSVTAKMLAGAEFHITSADLNFDQTLTTDAEGKIYLRHVKDGTYIITETKAPDGYILPEGILATQTVVLDKNSENTVTVPFKDAPKTSIVIYKTDSVSGEPLGGAQFEIKTVAGKLIGYYDTDSTGAAYTTRLLPGVYVVKEVKAPAGYVLDSTPQNAIVETNNATLLKFTDKPLTTITITKTDVDGKPLEGAEFIVKDVNGLCATTEGSYVTGLDGTVVTSPVLPGKYSVYEIKAPEGYVLDKTQHCVWVVSGEKNNLIVRNAAQGSIIIIKTDTDGKPLAGSEFRVETAEGKYIGQFTTDHSGQALISRLTEGAYIVKEVKAPTGYEIDPTPQTVVVKNGQSTTVTFADAKKGGLIVHLQDQADGSNLADGQFTITRCLDNSIVATGTSDITGTWMVGNLIPGKYIITQTYAPKEYTIVDAEKTEFVVAGTNKDVYFMDCTSGLVVELVDSTTGDTIQGGRFQVVRNSDNIVIGEYETDLDGLALVKGLIPGMYSVKNIVLPTGYVLVGEVSQLTHVKANETAHINFKATPIVGITLHSMDADTKQPLAGTIFEVWTQNGTKVGSYTTDTTGTVQTNKLVPGFYVIKQTYAENGYTAVIAEKIVQVIAAKEVTETFESVSKSILTILGVSEKDVGLSGMKVTVSKQNGELVGEYVTDNSGEIIIEKLPAGYYVVTEVMAPDGYVIKTATKTIQVLTTKPAEVKFDHDAVYGLQIRTTAVQTGVAISGIVYEVTKLNGEKVGTFTSDKTGIAYVTLEPGDYVVTQLSVPKGFTLITESRNVTVVANKVTVMDFALTQLSSAKIRFVDGKTNQGVYGVRILMKDSKNTIVDEFSSNDEGYIEIDRVLADGVYTIEMIAAPAKYSIDKVVKTIKVLNGETTEVIWKCWTDVGQIQVLLTSSEFNEVTGVKAGVPIKGATFTIIDADTFAIMDTMTTDVNGVAASAGLPIGRYFVKQSGGAPYYMASDKQLETKLKIVNDVVRLEMENKSLNLKIATKIKSNKQVAAGNTMRYDILSINNESGVSLDNFYWHIKVPTDAERIATVYTGKWNSSVNYSIQYKTNMTDYRVLVSNLISTNPYQYDLSSTALGLQSGEYVTDVRFVFGTVPAGFKLTGKPAVTMYVLPNVYNGYKLINRVEAGGQYNGYWYTGTSIWTTALNSKYKYGTKGTRGYAGMGSMSSLEGTNYPKVLPKTGY